MSAGIMLQDRTRILCGHMSRACIRSLDGSIVRLAIKDNVSLLTIVFWWAATLTDSDFGGMGA